MPQKPEIPDGETERLQPAPRNDYATPRNPRLRLGLVGSAVVGDRYAIEDEIGAGGFASVYRAYDARLKRHVALKVLHQFHARHPQIVTRFMSEAYIAADLGSHPNIVTIFDVGDLEEDLGLAVPYIAMEWMEGGTLADLLGREGRLSFDRALEILQQVGRALDHAHLKKVVHRDVKPANILFTTQDAVKLGDFGIARAQEATRLTGMGHFLGTVAYMAPEQAEWGADIDHRADLYALGVLTFELLTGQVPFVGDTPEAVLRHHQASRPPSIRSLRPDLPSAVDAALERALAKQREERPPSARAFLDELTVAKQALADQEREQERAAQERKQQRLPNLYDEARAAYDAKRWGTAVEALREIVAVQPDYRDADRLLALATRQHQELVQHWTDGRRAYEAGSWEEAIRHLETVVALDASDEEAARLLEEARRRLELAKLYAEARRMHEAKEWKRVVEVFEHIKGLDPTHSDPENLRASALSHVSREQHDQRADDLVRPGRMGVPAPATDVEQTSESHAASASAARSPVEAPPSARIRRVPLQAGVILLIGLALVAMILAFWVYRDDVSRDELRTLRGHTDDVNAVAFSPDGQFLASGGDDATVQLWRVADGEPPRLLKAGQSGVNAAAFSPDGQTLASGSGADYETADDATVRLWRVADGELWQALEGHTAGVYSVAFSPDGQILASGSWDNTIRLWRVADGVHLRTLRGHTDDVNAVAFSPDGQFLASGGDDATVQLWRVVDGEHLRALEGHTRAVHSVAFSPDGQILASGSTDNTIQLWRVENGEHLRTLEGYDDTVESVAFSPDGQFLASGGDDTTVWLWRVVDGEHLRTLEGHTDDVNGVAFSPDGQTLASGSTDMTIRLWRVREE